LVTAERVLFKDDECDDVTLDDAHGRLGQMLTNLLTLRLLVREHVL